MSSLITPGNLSHLHLLLNHCPTVGLTVAFALLVVSILSDTEAIKGDTMRPTALGVLFGIAVMTLPVFTTGLAAQGAIEKLPGISKDAMSAHEHAPLVAFARIQLADAVAAARVRSERSQRDDVLHRHAEGLHHQRRFLLEADLPADRGRGPAVPHRLARGVEDRGGHADAFSRARHWCGRALQLRRGHV